MRCQCGGRSEVGEVVREEEEDGLLLPSSLSQPAMPQSGLYIIAILLQREVVELLVPLQSLAVLTLLYFVNPRPSDLVHSWDESDYRQAMWYVSLDVVIELAVFVITVFVLKGLYPGASCLVILRGVLGQHFPAMCIFSFACLILVFSE